MDEDQCCSSGGGRSSSGSSDHSNFNTITTTTNNKNSGTSTIYSDGGGGFVETSKAERAVWLMKCPPLVSRCLHPPSFSSSDSSSSSSSSSSPSSPPLPRSDPSRPVAKVVLSIDPLHSHDDDSSPQFTMELAGAESRNEPKCYSMNMSTDFVPMSAFSESPQGRICVEGKILNKFDMKPRDDDLESYGKLCRERTTKYMTKSRQIQIIGNDRGTHMRPLPWMDKKKIPAKVPDLKRTRRDRGEMEDIMFKLFERQSNWTLRQLIQDTDQPEQFLKDILKDLCVYNNRGTNQGTYELKPEYKRSAEEPDTTSS